MLLSQYHQVRRLLSAIVRVLLLSLPLFANTPGFADDVAAPAAPEVDPQAEAKATAITLNYCRASFHRIRKSPTEDVLREEEEKILNNLSLTQLSDPEVIGLYTAVLDEIGQVEVADREREMYHKHHRALLTQKVTWDAVAFTTDIATAQFGNAIRTGANGWWDYRKMSYNRENDLLKVDRNRINSVVKKSSQFLDTFWHLAQKKNIPDRWLVRGDDLDGLEEIINEKDPEVRLRVLRRMEPFMEAYPPYWYYLGRTQQQLGQLPDALSTYERLEELGKGHFRKDDMLATAMANEALILESQGSDRAMAAAERALFYSGESWEANLICARILERGGRIADAEDAIFRNLDVDLEKPLSQVFLASLYYHANDNEKLAEFLRDDQTVAELPAPVLLRCAARLGSEQTPPNVLSRVMHSIEAQPRYGFGPDELHIRAAQSWQLHLAEMRAYYGETLMTRPQIAQVGNWFDLRFSNGQDWGNPLNPPQSTSIRLEFEYPDATVIEVALGGSSQSSVRTSITGTQSTLHIVSIKVGNQQFAEADSPATPVSLLDTNSDPDLNRESPVRTSELPMTSPDGTGDQPVLAQ
ncbi:MAG: hypothetical protein H6824_06620 [Planctomycetaceae bacterium]|nr:hypothetical protein [Planctomycetaceae bacterium]